MKYIGCLLILISFVCAGPAGAAVSCNECQNYIKVAFEMAADHGCPTACTLVPDAGFETCAKRCSEYLGICTAPDCCAKNSKEDCMQKYCLDMKNCPK